jgi:hypothetical protein
MTTLRLSIVYLVAVTGLAGAAESDGTMPNQEDLRPVGSLHDLELEPDTRIRVIRADGSTVNGRFQAVDAETLSLRTDEASVTLPEEAIYQIYRVEKRRGKGALRGLLVGLGITAALGFATLTQATESGEGGLGFGIGLMFAVPISTGIGVILSPDRRDLVFENPEFTPLEARAPPAPEEPAPSPPAQVREPPPKELLPPPRLKPEIPRSFYAGVSGGASLLGGQPFSGASAEIPGASPTFAVQGLYRATGHWGFGGEVLFTDAGTWRWETEQGVMTDSRKIVAPGFKVYYYPVVGANELIINGGVSAFKQDAMRIVERPRISQSYAETKLDPYFNIGVSYRRFVHPNIGLGADVQYYGSGSQIPDPLVLFSVSVSFRATPPPVR